MLKSLKRMWRDTPTQPQQSHDISLAVTALMVCVMQQDDTLDKSEHDEILQAVQEHFSLSEAQALATIEKATTASKQANDLYQFTSPLIKAYSQDERIDIIRRLWRVAMADHHIDPHEEALIRKVAELIGVHHHQFIDAKISARNT